MQAVFPSPALHAIAVAADGLSFRFPLGFPVGAFAGAGFKPCHADWPGAVSVFAPFHADGQCFDGVGVLEETAQCACGTGGSGAKDTACVGDAGEDVFVRLED